MRRLLLWFSKWLDVYESGHRSGPLSCSRYGKHRHLPLDLIQWYPTDRVGGDK